MSKAARYKQIVFCCQLAEEAERKEEEVKVWVGEQAEKQVKIEWKSTRKIEKCLPEMRHVTIEEAPLQVPVRGGEISSNTPPPYTIPSHLPPLSNPLLSTANTWKIQD